MFSHSAGSPVPRHALWATLVVGLVLVWPLVGISFGHSALSTSASWHADASPQLGIASFTVQPSSIYVGSTAFVNVSLSGGTPPYFLWFNSSVPGCQPPNSPVQTQYPQYPITCQPSGTGTYSIHLDVVDSATPAGRASNSVSVTVLSGGNGNNNNNNNNNNGNGSGNGGSLSLPTGLEQLVLLIGLVFLGTMVAIAAGTIATAAMVSRRLRQINETLAKMGLPPKEPKPPA